MLKLWLIREDGEVFEVKTPGKRYKNKAHHDSLLLVGDGHHFLSTKDHIMQSIQTGKYKLFQAKSRLRAPKRPAA